jgi:hypothetical protein
MDRLACESPWERFSSMSPYQCFGRTHHDEISTKNHANDLVDHPPMANDVKEVAAFFRQFLPIPPFLPSPQL